MLLLAVGFAGGRLIAPSDVRLAEEHKQPTAAKPPEQSRTVSGESTAPQPESPPRQETQVAVGVLPLPPVSPPPEKTWRNSIGMDFVLISAGEFMMGSESGRSDEQPVHRVRISKHFYLGKYEVTQTQWKAVMGDTPSRFKGDTLPVEQVSWEDAQKFIERLNAKEGGPKYRLPTEAEWEYAARAGTTTAYSFGDDPGQLGEYAWFGENSGNTTHSVGQKKPNPWGLYDMHGNVWEWVENWYAPYTEGYGRSTAVDPPGPSLPGSNRVGRGGSWGWHDDAGNCRSASRGRNAPGDRAPFLGFRLLREVP